MIFFYIFVSYNKTYCNLATSFSNTSKNSNAVFFFWLAETSNGKFYISEGPCRHHSDV
jgi:hypothetical protein